jgi:hypothetical protein
MPKTSSGLKARSIANPRRYRSLSILSRQMPSTLIGKLNIQIQFAKRSLDSLHRQSLRG